jgi:hypothetical protein
MPSQRGPASQAVLHFPVRLVAPEKQPRLPENDAVEDDERAFIAGYLKLADRVLSAPRAKPAKTG